MTTKIQVAGTLFEHKRDDPTRSAMVRLAIPNIDWLDLAEQKSALVHLIWTDPDNPLWGLVHLLDEIQDQAAEGGHNVVWESAEDPSGKGA